MKTTTIKFAAIFAIAIVMLFQGCADNSSEGILGNSQEIKLQRDSESGESTYSSVEFYGRVETVNSTSREITIVGLSTVINVLEGAEIVFKWSGSETPITLDDIMLGDSIEVRGNMGSGDVLMTDRVRIRPDDELPENELEFGGRVESIDTLTRVMTLVGDSHIINIHANAEVVAKNSGSELPISLSEIMIGDSVDVRGALQMDGSVLANRVRVRLGGEDFHTEIEFTQTIISIDYVAGIIMVDSVPEAILVDENTFIYAEIDMSSKGTNGSATTEDDDDDNPADTSKMLIVLTDLNAGDRIEVHANRVDANTLYAVAIELEDGAFGGEGQIEFKDVLASVDPATGIVTFTNESWVGTVVDGAELLGLMDELLTIADFSAGEIVEVRGFASGENQFDIVSMEKENNL